MGSSAVATNHNSFEGGFFRRRAHYRPYAVAPSIYPCPKTLLVDSDPLFAYAFEQFSRRYHVPVHWIDSIVSLSNSHQLDYGLVLLDWESSGGEFVFDIAKEIHDAHGEIPILVVGYDEPSKADMKDWGGIIRGFSDKSLGVESVFNDAVSVYVTDGDVANSNLTSLL